MAYCIHYVVWRSYAHKAKQMSISTDTKNKEPNSDCTEQTFHQYVLNTLTVADFNNLPDYLKLGKRKTTMLLKDPSKMKLSIMEKMAALLKVELATMVDQYKIGYDALSVRQYKKLMAKS